MTNIFWPVYKNLESEFNTLMFIIHIDDKQLSVYSSKIADLILRSATEIESISKELYYKNGGTKTGNIKYDQVALKYLNQKWNLSDKVVIISSYNSFQTNKQLEPFKKNEKRTGSNYQTYSWNNSYQNLKHDRANSLEFGSLKYLFDIMSALFLLNIYFKNEVYELNKDSKATDFDPQLGSTIFSIKLHKTENIDLTGNLNKSEDFNECAYYIKPTEKATSFFTNMIDELNKKNQEIKLKSVIDEVNRNLKSQPTEPQKIIELVKSKLLEKKSDNSVYQKLMNQKINEARENLTFEAKLNTNSE